SIAATGVVKNAMAEEETREAIEANVAAQKQAQAQAAAEQNAAQAQATPQEEVETEEESPAAHTTPSEHAEKQKPKTTEPEQEEADQQKKQPEQKPESSQNQTTPTPAAPKEKEEKEEPEKKPTDEQPISETPQKEQQPTTAKAEATPSASSTETKPNTKTPPSTEKSSPETEKPPQKTEEAPATAPTKPEEKPATQPTPPKPAESGLSDVGPHQTEPKTPPTLDKDKQPDVANQEAVNKNQGKNTGAQLADNAGQKAGGSGKGGQTIPRKIIQNAKNRFESKRSRRRKIKKEIESTTKELKKLENKIDDVKASGKMQVIKFFFPGIYAKIMGMSMGAKNLQGKAKVLVLETKLATVRTIKYTAVGAKLIAALIDANTLAVEAAAPFMVTIILAIIGIPLYIFVLFSSFIGIFAVGKGAFTTAFQEIIEQLNGIIENILNALTPEKKKIQLRRKIVQLNQDYLQGNAPQAANDNTESKEPAKTQEAPPAANDNTEQAQQPDKKAA
ncbi:MAG: hypothetical protein ACD_72C00397G0001, partial [uncultured bacterium]